MLFSSLKAIKHASEPHANGNSPSAVTCGATVMFMRRANNLYKACMEEECNKKVTQNEDGTYR